MLREIQLWVKKDGDDVDLGSAYDEDVPRQGDLLTHVTEHGRVWRVLFAYRQMVQRGSPAWTAWQAGQTSQPRPVIVFVEPAEVPYEP